MPLLLSTKPEIAWQPIPGTSQELALDTRCNHTLFHGARGPGKTVTQLMRFRRRVGLGYGLFWRGLVLDTEYKHLADIVEQSKRFFYAFEDEANFLSSASEYKWVWPTGEQLLFRHAKKLSDYEDFHGHEYPSLNWNELTKHAVPDLYDKMMSVNRSSFVPEIHTPKRKSSKAVLNARLNDKGVYEVYDTPDGEPLPPIPLEVFSTTNPSGPGHGWVKRRFIDKAAPGEVFKESVIVFDPRTKKDVEVIKTQVHIFGSWRENVFLAPEYVARLEAISDPNLRRAWLYGDWNVTAGGALDDLWDADVHVLPVFDIPKGWRIDRSFDWGSTEPFHVAWWAEANGEEMTLPDGSIFCPVAGSLIMVAEWYGCKKLANGQLDIGSNKGLKMSATAIAEGIRDREIEFMRTKFFRTQPKAGPADNQIRNVIDVSDETTETKMANKGIRWTESDKSPGSNAVGLQMVRDRLEAALRGEGKALYFMRNCAATIALLPPIPRDEKKQDEVDKNYEKHVFDTTKYRVLAGNNRAATNVSISFVN